MVSGNLGRAAAHKTVVDQPPWAEPLSLRLGLQPPTTDKHPKPVAIASGGHDGQMDGVRPSTPQSYRSFPAPFISAAWKLLELWI